MKRALISVSDKEGIVEFSRKLKKLGYTIISTGGTKDVLEKSNIEVMGIDEYTGFPEIMDGRVKTLHPKVHGGLLCVRENRAHIEEVLKNNIELIDMVVVNLYPFNEVLKKGGTHNELIENIDIGGPSMLRSAGKNYKSVDVIVDPKDYEKIIDEIEKNGETKLETRENLARKVFTYTASYDSVIAGYLNKKCNCEFPEKLTLTYDKKIDLRYGENHQQKSSGYKSLNEYSPILCGTQLNGKELSYNNIQDSNSALEILMEFDEPTVVAVKHTNPCGVGSGENIYTAWKKAYESDPVSIFGGIVAFNRELTNEIAMELSNLFLEVIIAPSFSEEALEILKIKKNIRLLQIKLVKSEENEKKIVSIQGGILLQEIDREKVEEYRCVTEKIIDENIKGDMDFAWKIVKHIKSNAIVIVKDKMIIGVGAGQMNRVGAAKIALEQGGEKCVGSVMASDAFFPMDDTVELASTYGIKTIVQPGGSIKDKLSIDKCNEKKISMVFTNIRHFKH